MGTQVQRHRQTCTAERLEEEISQQVQRSRTAPKGASFNIRR